MQLNDHADTRLILHILTVETPQKPLINDTMEIKNKEVMSIISCVFCYCDCLSC